MSFSLSIRVSFLLVRVDRMPRRCAATVTKIVDHRNEYRLLSRAAAYGGIVYDTKVANCLNMTTSAYLTFVQN